MKTENNSEFDDQSLKRYVKISMILHVGLFLAFTLKATFFNEPPVVFEEAIKVDLVGLPDKLPTELPGTPAPAPEPVKTAEPEPPKPEPKAPEPPPKSEPTPPVVKTETVKQPKIPPKAKDPEAINLDKAKNKQKQALEKLKQMEALAAIEKDLDSENKKKAAQAAAKAGADAKIKGNVISPGTSLTGIQKLEADAYSGNVHRHMLNHWTLPEYMKNRKLRTDVLIRFDEQGNILSKEIVKPSGNPAFDELVLSAIQKSSPAPPPPAKLAKVAEVQGFLFRFSHDQ